MRCSTKFLLFVVGAALFVGGSFAVGLPQKGMAHLVKAALAKRYSGQIRLEALELHSHRRLSLRNFALLDEEGRRSFFEVPRLHVDLALLRFFSGMQAVDCLTFEGLRLDLHRDGDGNLAVMRCLRQPAEPRKGSPAGDSLPKAGGVPSSPPKEAAPPAAASTGDDEGLGIVIRDGTVRYSHPRVPLIKSIEKLDAELRRMPGRLRIRHCSASLPMPFGLRLPISVHDVLLDFDDPRRSEGLSEKARIFLYLFRELFELLGR